MARDNPRCLPPTRTLRRIRWPLQPRFRDRPTAFGECDDRWTTLSRHPGSWPILHLITWMKADRQSIVSIDTVPEIFRPQTPRRLGPRSLVPPLFSERCVRAYSRPGCCLPTSATAQRRTGNQPELSFPRRDDGHDHLPFLTHHARPSRVTPRSGDTRRAAHASEQS